MGDEVGIRPVIIRGEELKQKGFGGTARESLLFHLILHSVRFICVIIFFILFFYVPVFSALNSLVQKLNQIFFYFKDFTCS